MLLKCSRFGWVGQWHSPVWRHQLRVWTSWIAVRSRCLFYVVYTSPLCQKQDVPLWLLSFLLSRMWKLVSGRGCVTLYYVSNGGAHYVSNGRVRTSWLNTLLCSDDVSCLICTSICVGNLFIHSAASCNSTSQRPWQTGLSWTLFTWWWKWPQPITSIA